MAVPIEFTFFRSAGTVSINGGPNRTGFVRLVLRGNTANFVRGGGSRSPSAGERPLQSAGLAPGLVGLYQFNVIVPSGVTRGDAALALNGDSVKVPQNLVLTVE